jgi:PAS domain S-box-containing protein
VSGWQRSSPEKFWNAAKIFFSFPPSVGLRTFEGNEGLSVGLLTWLPFEKRRTRRAPRRRGVRRRLTEAELVGLITRSAAIVIERRASERALRESEQRICSIVTHAAVGVVEASVEGRITFCNQRFCDYVGHTEAELLARQVVDITHPDDVAASIDAVERIRSGAPEVVFEKRYVHKSGQILWGNCSLSAIRDVAGKVEHCVAIFDITARKRAESHARFLDQLRETAQRLTLAMKAGRLEAPESRGRLLRSARIGGWPIRCSRATSHLHSPLSGHSHFSLGPPRPVCH